MCSRLLPAGTENGQTSEEEMCTISSDDESENGRDVVAGDREEGVCLQSAPPSP